MQIIKDGKIVQDDWRHVADDQPLPSGKFTISLQRWLCEKEALQTIAGPLGLRMPGEAAAESIAGDIDRFSLITLEIPAMADGRAFTLARLLRDRHGYAGEIRARGSFIRDQMFFLSRVGVNAFEFDADTDLAAQLPALTEFTVRYQASSDEKRPLFRRRN